MKIKVHKILEGILLILAICSLIAMLIVLYLMPESSLVFWFLLAWIILFFSCVALMPFRKCPKCGRDVGSFLMHKYCSHCGYKFSDEDELIQ